MTYRIKEDACIKCGGCVSVCPVGVIALKKGAFEIDAEQCISCGVCAEACPVDAVTNKA